MTNNPMDENIARLVSNSIKRVTAVKPTPQQKADIRMNKEETESNGHYEEAEEHLSKANDADAKGDKMSYHHHMSDHHDSMSQWHEERGRSGSADKHAEKADMHSDKYTQHARGMSEESIAEVTKQSAIKQYKDIQNYKPIKAKPNDDKKEFIKITMRRGNTKVLEDKDSEEYDQEGDMAMTQLRSIIHHAQQLHDQLDANDNLPEWVQNKITLSQDYMQTAHDYMYSQKNEEVVQEKRGLWDNIHAKRKRIAAGSGERMRKPGSEGAPTADALRKSAVKEDAEQIEEGSFKYHMDKAIEAGNRGDEKRKTHHLENARTAKFAMSTTEYTKHRDLLAQHKQMANEQVVAEGSGGAKYKIKQIGSEGSKDYYISPNTGKKIYKKAQVGDHETPNGEHKPKLRMPYKESVAEEGEQLDEISAETQAAYSKASHKDRMTQAVKVIGSSGHDKEAAQKLKVRNAGLKRISDRIYDKSPKATPAPKPPLKTDYGYGKGRYMGDSVEMQGNKIDELSPATLSAYKKAAGQSASNLDKSADKEFALGNKTAGVALTNKANKRFSGIVRATKKQ